MPEMLSPIMIIQETAEYLRIPLRSLYKLAQEGKVPCQKVGRHWRFHRASLDLWIGTQPLNTSKTTSQKQEIQTDPSK